MRFPGFFDEEFKLERISTLGDPLERLNQVVNWEIFSEILLKAMQSKERKGAGGRPAYNAILMFKILILQRLYNLSDDQTEYQINDRLSFMRFLGLGLSDKVPDAKTIWLFRETLKNSGAAEELFSVFRDHLQTEGIITHTGSIVDASIIERRQQHIGKEAYTQLKEGETPEEWQNPENKNKVRQIDKEARITIKNKKMLYGYKLHSKVDADSKCIVKMKVTPANEADNMHFVELLDENTDKVVYADKGYVGKKIPEKIKNQVHERADRGHPLSKEAEARNRQRTPIRARVEHVYGSMKGSMKCGIIRCVGLLRSQFQLFLLGLVYNMKRYCFEVEKLRKQQAIG